MIVDEKLLELPEEPFPQIPWTLDGGVVVILAFGRDEPVVFNGLPVLVLLAEDGADDTAPDDASRKRGFVHQHQHVQRVSIVRHRGRHEPEIIRKRHARGQHGLEPEEVFSGIERVLVAAALRGLDHDLNEVGLSGPADRERGKRPGGRTPATFSHGTDSLAFPRKAACKDHARRHRGEESGDSAMPELDGFAAASGSRRLVTLQGKRKRKDLRLRAPNDADLTVPLEDGQQHVTDVGDVAVEPQVLEDVVFAQAIAARRRFVERPISHDHVAPPLD